MGVRPLAPPFWWVIFCSAGAVPTSQPSGLVLINQRGQGGPELCHPCVRNKPACLYFLGFPAREGLYQAVFLLEGSAWEGWLLAATGEQRSHGPLSWWGRSWVNTEHAIQRYARTD